MDIKRSQLITLWVFIIIISLLLASAFPPLIKEKFNLYRSFEYSQMYLGNDTYDKLIIEYDYQSGEEPSERVMEIFEEKVQRYTDKKEVRSKLDEELPFNETVAMSPFDERDISEIRKKYRNYERSGDTISIYVLYLNGTWEKHKGTLGIADRPDTIVIFQREIHEIATRTHLEKKDIEQAILIHEFGHLLSLVGKGYESEHEDVMYPGHCDESLGECVMSGSFHLEKEKMNESPPLDFCELCQSDIEYIRDKESLFGLEDGISYSLIILQFGGGIWVTIKAIKANKKINCKYK